MVASTLDDADRPLVGFVMVAHAMFHTYELTIPVFVVSWLDGFPVTAAELGLVVGAGYALVGLGAVPSGVLADRYGSKRLVVVSIGGMGLGFLLLSVAPSVPAIAAALVVWGAAASIYHPAGLSLLSRGTTRRGSALAYHGAAGNVGTALGPLVAVVLLTVLDWRATAALLVVPAVVAVVLVARLEFDEHSGDTEPVSERDATLDVALDGGRERLTAFVAASRRLFVGGFVVAFAVVVLYGLYYRGVSSFLPEVLSALPFLAPVSLGDRTLEPGQFLYVLLLLVGVVGQYIGGRLTDRVETERVLLVTFGALVVVSLLFVPASTAGVLPLLVVGAALGFLLYMAVPVYQATIANHAREDVHGLSYGYVYLGMFGVGAMGAFLAGTILTVADVPTLFTGLAVVALGCALLSVVLLRLRRSDRTVATG